MPDCEVCSRPFAASDNLKQHIRDLLELSPTHRELCCGRCNNKVFISTESKNQHLVESPKHRICSFCPGYQDFETKRRLKHHLRVKHSDRDPAAGATRQTAEKSGYQHGRQQSVPSAATPISSPLDQFFASYPSFSYSPSLPAPTSYQALLRHLGWKQNSREAKELKSLFREALREEVDVWFGKEDDIRAWHTLCRAVGIHRPPDTVKGCTHVLRNTHVNIVDLIEWGRGGGVGSVQVFETESELVRYSLENDKIFPRNEVQTNDGEANVVLRHLLRRIVRR